MLKKIIVTTSTVLEFLSVYMFYSLYWKWDFNENGRAFDPIDSVTYDSSSQVWGYIAIAFFLPLLIAFLKRFQKSSLASR